MLHNSWNTISLTNKGNGADIVLVIIAYLILYDQGPCNIWILIIYFITQVSIDYQ